jgi:LytS/YehU family sensor histidine kinase
VSASFLLLHLVAAGAYSFTWFALNSVVESALRQQLVIVIGFNLGAYLIMGVWLYVMSAGVLYASEAATRAARAELHATQSQLATLRGQLNPHFLFNALHTVVQLIPRAPDRAARAAEDIAGLLRTSLEEGRDLVPLEDEWRFVQRYLEMEGIRFGDRLRVTADLAPDTMDVLVPSFALQTLVENAVRHGAAPRVEPTTITIRAARAGDALQVTVTDDGMGPDSSGGGVNGGTGLKRLRDRLVGHFGSEASVSLERNDGVTRAELQLPWRSA